MAYAHEDSPPMSSPQQRTAYKIIVLMRDMSLADHHLLNKAYLEQSIPCDAQVQAVANKLRNAAGVSQEDFDAFWESSRQTHELSTNMTTPISTDGESEESDA